MLAMETLKLQNLVRKSKVQTAASLAALLAFEVARSSVHKAHKYSQNASHSLTLEATREETTLHVHLI